jgi:hypothetical protein
MKYQKILAPCIVGLATLGLASCAPPSMQLTSANATNLKTIKISPNVTTPKQVYYMGGGSTIFGLIGLAANEKRKARFNAFEKRAHIRIGGILSGEVRSALRRYTPYHVVNSQQNATMYLTIRQYGLSITTGFGRYLKPVLYVTAKLVDSNGKKIWQDSESVTPMSSAVQKYNPTQTTTNPNLLVFAWDKAAKVVAKRLAYNLARRQTQ